ncbi:MAG TPA: L-threonylcarbamoyladenylate synthase [Bacteroidales bacterium]|jgi:tRNA threonylcarbamoyl adenosine modification protein (Sua5/YciO/YrdC/YwlC family)|nr:L-threonylcarbamoyladenylate synthase [Bacteroidales bacterium]
MLLKLYENNPNKRHINQVVDCLKSGGVIIYPTDTIYGIGCDLYHTKALERLCLLTNKKREKSNFSFICYDLKNLSDYTLPLNNTVFKLMKEVLPGPYTFVLEANSNVPKHIQKKKTVGIRVPDNNIARAIVEELGNPILNASLKIKDDFLEYYTDPELIYEQYHDLVDIVIDGGAGDFNPSSVIRCVDNEISVIRKGKGDVSFIE